MKILFDYIGNCIAKTNTLPLESLMSNLELPNNNLCDVALPCFKFAKEMKRSPVQIASELASKINDKNIEKVESVNGYLNFTFKRDYLVDTLLNNALIEQADISKDLGMKGKTVLIEHTSINPNASPHIGRARNALIADSLVRVFKFLGWKTDVHYYVNDAGKQIAMLAYATKDMKTITFDGLLKIYIDINEKAKTDPNIETEVFAYLNRFEHNDKKTVEEFERIVSTCLNGQRAIFDKLNIKWDKFDYESAYIHNHRTDEVLALLQKSPKLFEAEDGRLVLDQHGEDIGIENPMLVLTRNDHTSLYCLRDICYSIDKDNAHTDRNILVLGEDQKVYFQQISAALKLLGHKAPDIVHYSFVLLPDGKMSTRNGTVVLLEDFMKEAVNKVNKILLERNGSEDNHKASVIAYGAIKYSILKCSPEKNVLFDWNTALNFNGDSSVFVQYNYARIKSVLKKANLDYSKAKLNLLTSPTEIALIKEIAKFEGVIKNVYDSLNPSILVNFISQFTSKFSQFYSSESILNCESQDLKLARLNLIDKASVVIKNSLSLLGIDTLENI